MKNRIAGAVASSEASARRLVAHGIPLLDINEVERIPVYVDGADEIDESFGVVRGYAVLANSGATEKDFQDLIEIVRTRLRQEEVGHYGGVCLNVFPPQARLVEPRMFEGVLVHYCELTQRCQE